MKLSRNLFFSFAAASRPSYSLLTDSVGSALLSCEIPQAVHPVIGYLCNHKRCLTVCEPGWHPNSKISSHCSADGWHNEQAACETCSVDFDIDMSTIDENLRVHCSVDINGQRICNVECDHGYKLMPESESNSISYICSCYRKPKNSCIWGEQLSKEKLDTFRCERTENRRKRRSVEPLGYSNIVSDVTAYIEQCYNTGCPTTGIYAQYTGTNRDMLQGLADKAIAGTVTIVNKSSKVLQFGGSDFSHGEMFATAPQTLVPMETGIVAIAEDGFLTGVEMELFYMIQSIDPTTGYPSADSALRIMFDRPYVGASHFNAGVIAGDQNVQEGHGFWLPDNNDKNLIVNLGDDNRLVLVAEAYDVDHGHWMNLIVYFEDEDNWLQNCEIIPENERVACSAEETTTKSCIDQGCCFQDSNNATVPTCYKTNNTA